MQLGLNLSDGRINQLVAAGRCHLLRNDIARGHDGHCRCTVADFLDRAGLSRGDLVFGRGEAALDRGFEVQFGLCRCGFGICLGLRDDTLGLVFDLGLLTLCLLYTSPSPRDA